MLSLEAHAKVNWFLLVLRKRPDGFHDIQSLIQRIGLSDTLWFEKSNELEVHTEAEIPAPEIPAGENLVFKSALALRQRTGTKQGARIRLIKRIPLEAGLGGGSSDAAAALRGLNDLWGLGLSVRELIDIASTLGSDVPFFLGGPASEVRGRGEVLSPVEIRRPVTLLVLKPPVGVSSGWAYSNAARHSETTIDIPSFLDALEKGDFSSLARMAINDLQDAVIDKHPEVKRLRDNLIEQGALLSLMSGSGTSVFGVFPDRNGATGAAAAIKADFSFVTETIV